MPSLFSGRYLLSFPKSRRVSIPTLFRDPMPEEGKEKQVHFYLVPGSEGQILVYPHDTFQRIATQKMSGIDPVFRDSESQSQMIAVQRWLSETRPAQISADGRITLPRELAEYAGLEGRILLVGVFDHMEIWNPARFDAWIKKREGGLPKPENFE